MLVCYIGDVVEVRFEVGFSILHEKIDFASR